MSAASVRPSETELDDLRAHVRRVIDEHAPVGETREGHRAPETSEQEEQLRRWYRTLYAEGLAGADWPVEWGGRADHHPLHHVVILEELIRARAPRLLDQVQLASHVLLRFGSAEQLQRHLPAIREGTDVWCQLFSEPDAGSDLAGIRTKADEQPDGSFVLQGQKTWTTDGHWAQWGLALARTDAGGGRHDGITAFIVPMDAPGVDVRPLRTIGDAPEFNEVFLDGVVVAPEHVIGTVGEGWKVAMSGLEVERFGVGGNVALLPMLLDDLLTVARSAAIDGVPVLDRAEAVASIADLDAESNAAQAFVADHIERTLDGEDAVGDAAIAKLLYSECYNRIARYAVELIGELDRPPSDAAAASARRLRDAWLWSRALTISGGSSEIMRTILARRRLKLPSA